MMQTFLQLVAEDMGRWCDLLYTHVTETEIDAVRHQAYELGSQAGLEIQTELKIRLVACWLKQADHDPEELGYLLGCVQKILERNPGKRMVQQEFGEVRQLLYSQVNRVTAALATVV